MGVYNRLFTKILDSSIWLESDVTRIVWITLLAAMDEDGYAPFSCNENLARRANVPIARLQSALEILESPDKFNPNDEYEGRRIEKVMGGWMVLKAPYYRNLLTREIAREQNRVRVQRHRQKHKGNDAVVTKHYSNAAEHSKAEQKKNTPLPPSGGKPTRQMVIEFFKEEKEAEKFWDHYQSNGWKIGRNPMKDWEATARNWKRRKEEESPRPNMSPEHRQNKINLLNEKKQSINRQITDPNNPPSWAVTQLAKIDCELQQL